MLVSTEGIVLRQFPFSDTSIIVKIFTRDYGLVGFIVKGAKSKKKRQSPTIQTSQFTCYFLLSKR
jgi:DNA repair protein RecO (recombination protein O)